MQRFASKFLLVTSCLLFTITAQAESVILISSLKSHGTYQKTIDRVVADSLPRINPSIEFYKEDLSMLTDIENVDNLIQHINSKYSEKEVSKVVALGTVARALVSNNPNTLIPSSDKYLIAGPQLTEIKAGSTPKVISEAVRLEETINFASKHLPTLRRLVVIVGEDKNERTVESLEDKYSYKFDVTVWGADTSYDEVLKSAADLPPDTAIVFAGKLIDGQGNTRPTSSFVSDLVTTTQSPVFTTWVTAFVPGVIGGTVVSPDKVGETISKVLSGTLKTDEQLISTRLNFAALKRLGIDEQSLANDVIVLNKPVAFFDDAKKLTKYATALIATLLVIAVFLLFLSRVQSRKTTLLQKSEKKLLAEKAKSQTLFGVIAHELRTPVSAISMMTADSESGSSKEIYQTAQDLLYTIDDMSMMVNPDSARPIRMESILLKDFNELLHKRVSPVIASSGINYHEDHLVSDQYLTSKISSDFYRIRIALTNLIRNACLHSEGNNIHLTTRSVTDQKGDYLEWEIRDDGVGIKDADINRLFTAHERGQSKAVGTGLGLFIVKTFIEDIKGNISYQHSNGGGSTFVVRVPITLEVKHPIEQTVNNESARLDLNNKRILLVEDEAMLRMLGQKLVGTFSNTVETAQNGKEALENFNPATDIVFTDYFMPEMDGVELTKSLRDQGFKGLIIGVTAATIGDQVNDLWNAGCDDVISKPLTKDKLTATLVKLMHG